MTTDAQVREFLRRLRAPAPEVMRAVFTRGGCYALVEILQAVWPEATAWQTCRKDWKLTGDHVVAKIGQRYFDITGERHCGLVELKMWGEWRDAVHIGKKRYRRMTPAECRKARKWSPVCWDQVVRK